jgi:HEAT repeat protein
MTVLSLTLLLALAAPGTPARNARPQAREPATDASPSEAQAPTPTLTDEEVSQRVRTYLGAIDTPITAAQWRQLGSRAVPALESVLHDPDALPSRRAKAVEALSVIGGQRAKQLVVETARSDQEPFGVRASALRGAGRLLGQKELAVELRPVMENAREAPVRATAADVLAHHAGASSCAAVRAQVRREHGHERAQFSRALERCTPSISQ